MMISHLQEFYNDRGTLSSKDTVKYLNELIRSSHGQTGTMHPVDTKVELHLLIYLQIISLTFIYPSTGAFALAL